MWQNLREKKKWGSDIKFEKFEKKKKKRKPYSKRYHFLKKGTEKTSKYADDIKKPPSSGCREGKSHLDVKRQINKTTKNIKRMTESEKLSENGMI